MINVKQCMMVVLIELYPFTPLSVTMTLFDGHSGIEQLCYSISPYPIKFKLVMIVKYVGSMLHIMQFFGGWVCIVSQLSRNCNVSAFSWTHV